MNFEVFYFGKVRNSNFLSEIESLRKRLRRVKFFELRDFKDKNVDVIRRKEFEQIKSKLRCDKFKVLLAEESGKQFSSRGFYDFFKSVSFNDVQFVVSGPFGYDRDLESLVDLKLSLSDLTFTHEVALYLLVEQLYRFECFENNVKYGK